MRPLALIGALALLAACAPTKDEQAAPPPDEHGHGHHGHGHEGELNQHGYKGHTFDDPSEWLEHFESEERLAWQRPDELVAKLEPAADATIADLGAGTGYFALRFARAAPQGKVYAVDIESAMVEFLGERARDEELANLEAMQGQADDPQLPEAVDLVFMCNVFHHLADPRAYFEAVAGSLRPGARVAIVDFRKDNSEDAPGPPARMRKTPEEIIGPMESAGYRLVERDEELLEYQYLLIFELSG